jgi:hypothetical protein
MKSQMKPRSFRVAQALAFIMCFSACAPTNQTEPEAQTFPSINPENWFVIANDERVGFFDGKVQALENAGEYFSLERRESFLLTKETGFSVSVQSGQKVIWGRVGKAVYCEFAKRENPIADNLWVGDAYFLEAGGNPPGLLRTNQPVGFCAMFPQ